MKYALQSSSELKALGWVFKLHGLHLQPGWTLAGRTEGRHQGLGSHLNRDALGRLLSRAVRSRGAAFWFSSLIWSRNGQQRIGQKKKKSIFWVPR